MAVETKQAHCRFCHAYCPMEVDVEDNKVLAVRADTSNPVYGGYTCIKGRQLAEAMNHEERIRTPLKRQPDGPGRDWTLAFAEKFRFTEAAVAHARRRVLEILGHLSDRLRDQAARGSRYFVGDALTGADIAWAAFAAMLAPLPHEICPMSRGLRRMYTATEPDVLAALDPILLEHCVAMYRDHLATPLDF